MEKAKKIEYDENGKVRISLAQFDGAFRALLQGIPVQELHADPKTFKNNPVTPGIGPLVIDADTWAKRWQGSAEGAATDWEERALTPSRDPVEAAIAANKKRQDRYAEAEKKEKWLKTMKKRKKEDVFEGIQATGASGYKAKIGAAATKAKRRFTELQPKVQALKASIQAMSDATDTDREKRMLAARKGMLAIGET